MKKFDLRAIMTRAWKIFRKASDLVFGECLHRAWLSAKAEEVNVKRIEAAKAAAGATDIKITVHEDVGILRSVNEGTGRNQKGPHRSCNFYKGRVTRKHVFKSRIEVIITFLRRKEKEILSFGKN